LLEELARCHGPGVVEVDVEQVPVARDEGRVRASSERDEIVVVGIPGERLDPRRVRVKGGLGAEGFEKLADLVRRDIAAELRPA